MNSNTTGLIVMLAALIALASIGRIAWLIKKHQWNLPDWFGRFLINSARRAAARADAYDIMLTAYRRVMREGPVNQRCTGDREMEA
jgi:hypothetical protein